ncbi:hypothetical protein ACUY2Q_07970 [Corynebacterium bovis]
MARTDSTRPDEGAYDAAVDADPALADVEIPLLTTVTPVPVRPGAHRDGGDGGEQGDLDVRERRVGVDGGVVRALVGAGAVSACHGCPPFRGSGGMPAHRCR